MAIARNSNSDYFTSNNSTTVSGTYVSGSGSNRLMAFGTWHQTTGADLTGATYNSVASTAGDDEGDPNANGNFLYVRYLVAPATGSNTAAASRTTGTNAFALGVADYTGVSQSFTAAVGSNGASSVTSVSITVDTTSLGADCWIFTQAAANQVISAGTNFTLLTTTYDAGVRMGDSNGSVGAGGSKTVTINIGASGRVYGASFAFPPSASGPANVKTYDGLAVASVKTWDGLSWASVKTFNGLN